MSFRSIPKMANFRDAVQMCSGNHKVSELMPVDKLHHFHLEKDTSVDEDGLFRVNAIKLNNTWYKYSNKRLQEINFNHFEDFKIHQGMDGKLNYICIKLLNMKNS